MPQRRQLERLIKQYASRYIDPERLDVFGGRVIVVHIDTGEIHEFKDVEMARRFALARRGLSIIIQVPHPDEVDEYFKNFVKELNEY